MDNDIIDKILDKLGDKEEVKDELISFSDKRYKAEVLDKSNFHEISGAVSDRRIAFIDGGNTEVLSLPNLNLQLVRVYYNIFQRNKKIGSKRLDFYVFVEAVQEEGIKYKVEIKPDDILNGLRFDSFDESLREGKHRVKVSKVAEAVRRFLELHLAKKAVDRLDRGGVIVLDGSLKASITGEKQYFDALYGKCLDKGVIVSGLPKSCSLLTNKGNSVLTVLRRISPKGAWYYHNAVSIENPEHKADMFFVKLQKNSKFVFRYELFNESKYDIDEVLSLLMDNSKDPVFLGYPYGLIEADRFARVSNNEKEYLKTQLMVRLKKDDLEQDAHSVLDSVG